MGALFFLQFLCRDIFKNFDHVLFEGGICKNIDIEKNQLNIRSYVDYRYEVSTSTNWSFLRRFMAKMSEHSGKTYLASLEII